MVGLSGVWRFDVRAGEGERSPQVFERWEAGLSEAYVPLAVSPRDSGEFRGWIVLGKYPDVELSTLGAAGQRVDRTETLIARTDIELLHTSIQMAGHGRLHQDGRVAEVGPGEMVFYDSTRPYHWEFDGEWEMASVQVTLGRLRERTGITMGEIPIATTVTRDSPAGIVSGFLRELAELQDANPVHAAALAGSAVDLLASAISLTAGHTVPGESVETLNRRRVVEFMRRHCGDIRLTVDGIAAGCDISRRTLYRLLDQFDGGPATILRRMRIERACELLTARSDLPVTAVAHACGFATERQFYRAFRIEMGLTPAAYRTTGGAFAALTLP
ncbi:helix-turn-helix domain-containing protein [Nocardia seriolae]|uniref:AraC-like ligand-binding domain-containing protein n=1 Tax=Nocardia seriolae TaxID=37332 RepID=UPI00068B0289|nr:helix-turn-helix domain-containing protein [Nocardia seriolae]MTJ65211.1 helix-turn-helix domain-containing protein [Nocardia seriolae]MTJ76354.1 helix-turn-helix domain-containing protein [Nocardia seriolae]MTJ86869.1 helix-turn-helix domain-containing protein [Nocardia seriolae]MTK30864.1 helix-turn-helix domain-containing protein [Nocardia seriolae]MTK43166.1 helix-turn-helix domain-containing protein [Nocardia seriolae]